MKEQLRVNVPKAFLHPLFFNEDNQIVLESVNTMHTLHTSLENFFFLFDILHAQGVKAYRPWMERTITVPLLLDAWENEKPLIKEWFGKRNKREARPIMIKGISQFFMALYWINQGPVKSLVDWKGELKKLPCKPVNCLERMDYIIGAPDHYHSFIQLTELFDELNKQYQVSLIREKNSPRS